MSTKALAIIILFFTCAVNAQAKAAIGPTRSRQVSGTEAKSLCRQLGKIRQLPFYFEGNDVDYSGEDPIYDRVTKAGDLTVPCLIEAITVQHEVPDPRQAPVYKPVREGDVAFWIVRDITALPASALPPELLAREKKRGVYGYFAWVNNPVNRKLLQNHVRAWWRQKTSHTNGCVTCSVTHEFIVANAPKSLPADPSSPVHFRVASHPSGANLEIDGKLMGVTPKDVELNTGEHVLLLTKTGYKSHRQTVKVTHGMNAVAVGLQKE